ncbi:MAG: PAS domain-containing sensor histidine kinase [Prolixibacteraceae bacterium]|nr:PAS domain-containing sensor histidine kinase [Prolixibacteraceae bacterium]
MEYQALSREQLIQEIELLLKENSSIRAICQKDMDRVATPEEELNYQLLFYNSGEAILYTRPDGTIYSANPKACEIFGRSEKEICEVGRNGICDLTDPRLVPAIEERRRTGQFNGELNMVRKIGEVFPAEIDSTVFHTSGGLERTAMIIRDISERKLAEKKIKDKNEELQKINSEKDKFFSIIAHDLKSPFNSIVGFSSFLSEQVKARDYANIGKYAEIIHESSIRAMELLKNLMEWSQAQTGRIVFRPNIFDMVSLIEKNAHFYDDIAEQKAITLKLVLPALLPVYADEAMINTILRNLISNAIKFSYPSSEIIISAEQLSKDLVISIKDSGIGLSGDSIQKLFHLDENQSTPGTQNEKGTGLGLILCHDFVSKHNGKLWVESESEKGSNFKFSIPIKRD